MDNATHPDFSRAALSAVQLAWLASVGIVAHPQTHWAVTGRGKARTYAPVATGWGYTFSKGDTWIDPIAANHRGPIYLLADGSDLPEGNDGEPIWGDSFPTLKAALRALAAS